MKRIWDFSSAAFYGFSNRLLPLLLRLVGSLEIAHADRVPREGGAVIVANHTSLVDPLLVCAVAPRRLRPIAKRELFETPLVGWTVWLYGAFPVRRYSGDLGALRAGRNHLRRAAPCSSAPRARDRRRGNSSQGCRARRSWRCSAARRSCRSPSPAPR